MRTKFASGFLLPLLELSCFYAAALGAQTPPPEFRPMAPPIPGVNSVSNMHVAQHKQGLWIVQFDYFYTGDPYSAQLSTELTPERGAPSAPENIEGRITRLATPKRGANHMESEIRYPGAMQKTLQVAVVFREKYGGDKVLASQKIDQAIEWPDFTTWVRNQMLAKGTPQENLQRAVTMIDSEDPAYIAEAKTMLEGLLRDNPRFDDAYVELARVEMKSNWGTGGLHHAEELLQSALQIRPDSVNAKVLLGYVYAHQDHYAKADAVFSEAAAAKSNNLWLWTNWGELLEMEGKPDAAMLKYREAITRPMTHDSYDRARNMAYENLIKLLKPRSDLDGIEALYKQRLAEFGSGSCYSADYARFLLQQRGDAQAAIDLSTRALNQACNDTQSREVLGLAQYVKWAMTPGQPGADALNQARLYLSAGPKLLYLLAQSERTLGAARKLVASGEKIDQRDNEKMTALALALQDSDLAAAGRLLKLGAHPEVLVGVGAMPVALLPVFEGDVEAVRMLRRAGVDYSKISFQGVSAADFAVQSGNQALIKELHTPEARL